LFFAAGYFFGVPFGRAIRYIFYSGLREPQPPHKRMPLLSLTHLDFQLRHIKKFHH